MKKNIHIKSLHIKSSIFLSTILFMLLVFSKCPIYAAGTYSQDLVDELYLDEMYRHYGITTIDKAEKICEALSNCEGVQGLEIEQGMMSTTFIKVFIDTGKNQDDVINQFRSSLSNILSDENIDSFLANFIFEERDKTEIPDDNSNQSGNTEDSQSTENNENTGNSQSTGNNQNTGNNNASNTSEKITIEDVIFNRVPILDVNIFSNTAGGQNITADSPVDIIRKSIATWYVAFRNLAIVSLAVIIIYVGIRMALSTIPHDKAKYKTMIAGWVQAIVIVLIAHYIMIFVLNLNSSFLKLLDNALINKLNSNSTSAEGSIYETIRTRAYGIDFLTSIPATIMYIALIFIKIRFLWVYVKRFITVMILIIIAPFIGAKYAIDSAKGKKGTSFSKWLFDFSFNVLIQLVHALVYTVLITSALSFAFDSVVGYVIALIFLNFLLSADEIFRNIFEFDKRSSLSKDTAKQEGYKEVMQTFSGAMFTGYAIKMTWGFAKGAAGTVAQGAKFIGRKVPAIPNMANNVLDNIDSYIENAVPKSNTKGSPQNLNDIKGNIANAIHYQSQIRRLSRKKGLVGVKARKLRKSITSHRKKRYTANFKLIKNSVVGVGSVIMAVPLFVVNTKAGTGMMTKGILTLSKMKGKKYYKGAEGGKIVKQSESSYKEEKYTKKRDKLYTSIDLLNEISNREDDISNRFQELKNDPNISSNELENFKTMENIILIGASQTEIDKIIKEYVKENNIKSIDNFSINGIINEVAEKLDLDLDSATKSIIASRAKSKVIFMNVQSRLDGQSDEMDNRKFTNSEVAQIVQESVAETAVDNKFADISKDLFKLDRDIKEYEKKAKTKYRGANKFLDNL